MKYSISKICSIIQATAIINNDVVIEHLLIDSRKIVFPATSLFFALSGPRRDGHDYIPEVYERGIRCFVVHKNFDASSYHNAVFLEVNDVLEALQQLAAYHRQQFHFPVIGITGSNGKTIVKEWLYQLLHNDYNIVRSPRSFNSQIGVPLSIWPIKEQNTLGIFEAGISTIGEMEKLEKIIQPTIGILTNIGDAHNEGFANNDDKLREKLLLFKHADHLICSSHNNLSKKAATSTQAKIFSWGSLEEDDLQILSINKQIASTQITIKVAGAISFINIPFTDNASIENAIHCFCVCMLLKADAHIIAERMQHLYAVEMRMQLKKGINNCYILNDSYSNDIASLGIALDYLQQQAGNNVSTVILSDILQSGLNDEQLYQQVATELKQRNIQRLIGIGGQVSKHHPILSAAVQRSAFYISTENFLEQSSSHQFKDEYILLKGARVFAFERINHWLEQKVHQTVLEINLSAMIHNLKEYQKYLKPSTKLMAMVKAFSYGSGSIEVARILQFCKVDYLAVAYADEGIDLRKGGISLPIMVMNADEATFDALVEYNLEPEIYSFSFYTSFHQYLLQQGIIQFPVHIKINTGMNRLGFEANEMEQLASLLSQNNTMVVQSAFSHLVASEDPAQSEFTKHQASLFNQASNVLQQQLQYSFIKHIDNSSGIFRHPELQYDMVRLGIGLYGVDSANMHQLQLETVATLKSTIAQIRHVKATETVGYNRNGVLYRDSLIATIRIGYADGFSRSLGNRVGHIFVNGQLAPVIGNVCMDMVMIDITDIEHVKEGDVVEIFGKHLPLQQVAAWAKTIPYEIMTSVSQRVKRVYVEE
jgi:alanine racemase